MKCGGSREAKAAAVARRDTRLSKRQVLTYREFHQIRRVNNRSGAPDVMFLVQARMPNGLWQAKLKLPNGKQITKSFAVGKYGHKKAFLLAVAARTELLLLVEDRPFVHDATAKRFFAKGSRG